MIKAVNLSVSFGERQVLKNLNIQIPENQITVLSGPNGAGKTTLLKTFAGIIPTKDNQISNSFKEIFYLPQRPHCPLNITLFDYISLSFFKNSFKWFINSYEKQKIQDILICLGLYEKRDIFVENLSSGEFQMANIALALISNADCILFDEPTSNMDLINQIKVINIIKDLKSKNITSVVVMHDLNLASKLGDCFIGINQNFEVFSYEKTEFFTPEVLHKIFNLNFEVTNNDEKYNISVIN